jgi:DNA repair protein RecO (recombination protein O)
MSEIIKTEAVVLSKINYGDSSIISSLYSKNSGKMSVIVKGGRSSKSKIGMMVDPLNHLEIIFYKKESRDVQLLSGAEIISHFHHLKEDLDRLKYSYAVIELVKKLSPENEPNKKIFDGLVRILSLFDSSNEKPEILFGRFFLFFVEEVGYELQLFKCSVCGKVDLKNKILGYNYDKGLLCEDCKTENINNYEINPELFDYVLCLKTNKSIQSVNIFTIKNANNFFENYLKFHITGFKGIQSFKAF